MATPYQNSIKTRGGQHFLGYKEKTSDTAHDTVRKVNSYNDHSKERDGSVVGTIKCLAVGIESRIHHHPRHFKPPTLRNTEP